MPADVIHTQRFNTVLGTGRGSAEAQAHRDRQERTAELARIELGFSRFDHLSHGVQAMVGRLRGAYPDAVKARAGIEQYLAVRPFCTTNLWYLVAAGDPPTHPGFTSPAASFISTELSEAARKLNAPARGRWLKRVARPSDPEFDPERQWRAKMLAAIILKDLEGHSEYSDDDVNVEVWQRAQPLLSAVADLLERQETSDGAGTMTIVGARLILNLAKDRDTLHTILVNPAVPLVQAFARRLASGRASGDERGHLKQALSAAPRSLQPLADRKLTKTK